jgi:hypothetical protein
MGREQSGRVSACAHRSLAGMRDRNAWRSKQIAGRQTARAFRRISALPCVYTASDLGVQAREMSDQAQEMSDQARHW